MIIINSADYVIPEFRNEFGAIPPSFLPIGNKKLFTFQVNNLRKVFNEERIYLSLPDNFELDKNSLKLISSLNIIPIFIPTGISLGMALLYALNTIDYNDNEVLRLLHGDTLLSEIPTKENCIAVARTNDNYEWEYQNNSSSRLAWCGYFAFSSIKKFIRSLAKTQGKFTESIHKYSLEIPCVYEEVEHWYDFGHINTYFRSRSEITTQRAFNHLKIANGIVWKSGAPSIKIEAEANWFASLPPHLKRFTPQLLQSGEVNGLVFYETEYLPYLPLNEIFVHGSNPPEFWEKIFDSISLYMNECRTPDFLINEDPEKITLDSIGLYKNKTFERLHEYAQKIKLDIHKQTIYDGKTLPSIYKIAEECINKTLELPIIPSILHGDLCFSNIMFDSRCNTIKVIDPRGINLNKEKTIYGNQTYDLAKLCHSFIGLYDFIISDYFELEHSESNGIKIKFSISERIKLIQNKFMEKNLIPNINNKYILPATILLFLSMIPLHFDKPKRQEAMLANALRLYVMWKGL